MRTQKSRGNLARRGKRGRAPALSLAPCLLAVAGLAGAAPTSPIHGLLHLILHSLGGRCPYSHLIKENVMGAERAGILCPPAAEWGQEETPDSRIQACSTLPCVRCPRPCAAGPGQAPSLLPAGQCSLHPSPWLLPGLEGLCDNILPIS